MAHEFLHCHQVNAGIHEIAGKGAAHVMGGKVGQTCFLTPQMQLVGQGIDGPPVLNRYTARLVALAMDKTT